jgi:hypothetical protein
LSWPNSAVKPARREPAIRERAIVLEELDLVVDCNTQQLIPGDPNRIVSQTE